jgi:rhomboid family GlyGly-CTERM serine protease
MGLGQVGRKLPAALQFWTLPAVITLFSLFFELAADAGRLALRFDRAGISGGEFWRLLTGHFVHLGWPHLFLNIAGLILVWLLCGRAYSAKVWCVIVVLVLAGIDAGLWFCDPGLEWYVGLSGLLHGLLAAGVLAPVFAASREMRVLGLLVLVKLAWEQLYGPLPGSEGLAGAAVVVNAHLYGAVAGIAVAMVIRVGRIRPI